MKIILFDQTPELPLPLPGSQDLFIRAIIGPEQGAENFRIIRLRIAPGGNTPLHSHPWEEEIYVLKGEGELISDSGASPLRAGDMVFAAGDERHQFKNTGAVDFEFLCAIPVREDEKGG